MAPENVDTLVIGGGIAGTGIAYYLAERGVTDILLVEASEFGSGATAGSFGNVRQQFGTPIEIECSRRGLEFWKSAEERFGVPCPFHEDGYMLMTGSEQTAAVLRDQAEVQRAEGMTNVHLLSADEIEEVVPFVDAEGLVVGSYTPEDGHVTPQDGVNAYIHGGRRLGVRYKRDWPAKTITREDGRWRVEGGAEPVTARQVVVAAGTGTRDLLRPFGLDLDMQTVKHVSAITEPAFPDRTVPTVIDLDLNGMCIEREGAGLAVAMLGRNPAPQSYVELVEMFSEAAAVRAPSITELEVASELVAWPILGGDGMPLVGEVEEGLWGLAFTGHGVMHGPPIAEALADTLVGQPDETLDMSQWSIRRTPGEHTVLWRANASN